MRLRRGREGGFRCRVIDTSERKGKCQHDSCISKNASVGIVVYVAYQAYLVACQYRVPASSRDAARS